MRKTFELPAMQVVEVKNHDIVCTSDGQAGVENYIWNNIDEE